MTTNKETLKISAAVGRKNGKNAANQYDDVVKVQKLLQATAKHLGKSEYDPKSHDGKISMPPADSATVSAILAFQKRFLSKPDGQIDPGGLTWNKLLEAAGTKAKIKPKIVHGANYKEVDGSIGLNPELIRRVNALCNYLIENDALTGNIVFTQGVRAPATAHKWSTSWNIRKGRVPLKNLQDLTDGKDEDGNKWYDKAWEDGLARDKSGALTKESTAKLWVKIKENSKKYYSSDAVAAEGYKTSDSRIKPNVHPVTSNHITGNAMDVSIPWKAGVKLDGKTIIDGKNTDQAANHQVAKFALSRPVPTEMWHFQLDTTATVNASPANNTGEHPKSTNPHP